MNIIDRKCLLALLATSIMALGCGGDDSQTIPTTEEPKPKPEPEPETVYDTLRTDLLWNQGGTYKSYYHILNIDDRWYPCIREACDVSELIPNRPGGVNETIRCSDGSTLMASDGSSPSIALISLNYNAKQYIKQYDPDNLQNGFGIAAKREKTGEPIEFSFINMANHYTEKDSLDRLREVGMLFLQWGLQKEGPARWAFREHYRLGDFDDIQLKFKAKVDQFDGRARAMYVTCDFRYTFWDSNGKQKGGGLLGMLVFERNSTVIGPVHWRDTQTVGGVTSEYMMLRGFHYSIPQLKTGEYTEVTINFRKFLEMMPAPPDGFTLEDARIQGLDIYSSVRGSDLNFSIKDVRLYGLKINKRQ